jgi:hypothetical protein
MKTYQVEVWFATGYTWRIVAEFDDLESAKREASRYNDANGTRILQFGKPCVEMLGADASDGSLGE